MSTLNSVTFTAPGTKTGLIQVVDQQGNVYTGTYANATVVAADPSQDTFAIDPTVASTLDVTEVSANGGTSAVVKLDFTSQGNATPAAGSTAQPIADGTVFTGLTCTVAAINKNVSALQLGLQVTFQ
jgi:hypothetical protein